MKKSIHFTSLTTVSEAKEALAELQGRLDKAYDDENQPRITYYRQRVYQCLKLIERLEARDAQANEPTVKPIMQPWPPELYTPQPTKSSHLVADHRLRRGSNQHHSTGEHTMNYRSSRQSTSIAMPVIMGIFACCLIILAAIIAWPAPKLYNLEASSVYDARIHVLDTDLSLGDCWNHKQFHESRWGSNVTFVCQLQDEEITAFTKYEN